jgi:hypothetical protein
VLLVHAGLPVAAQDAMPDLPAAISQWTHSASVKARVGYKDNVALSSIAPDGSPFVGAAAELGLWRWLERTELEFFGTVDDRRFLAADATEKELTAYALGRLKSNWSDRWQTALGFEYVYQDQIVDVSVTEAELDRVRVRGHSVVSRPSSRWTVGRSWLELQAQAQRQLFQSPLDDYWEAGGKLAWGIPYGYGSEMAFSYEFGRRWFDTDEERTVDGVAIPGTQRVYDQQEARAQWRHTWDAARRWRTTTRVSTRWTEDGGSGFYDYTRGQLAEQIRFRTSRWDIECEARLSRYVYAVQTGDDGLSPRDRNDIGIRLSTERRLTSALKIFAEYTHERTLSNRELDSYSVNTVSGGLNWEF